MELQGYTFKGWEDNLSGFTPSISAYEDKTGRVAYFQMIGDPLPLTITAMCQSRFFDDLDLQPLIELNITLSDEDDGRIVTKTFHCYVTIPDLEAAISGGQHDDLWDMWLTCVKQNRIPATAVF